MTIPRPVDGPTYNVARILDWARHRFGEKVALVFEGREWTYWQLDEEVSALAHALDEAGIVNGDRVAIVGTNIPGYLILALALARVGAVAVTINYRLHESEMAEQLDRAAVVGLSVEHDFAELGRGLSSRFPNLRWTTSLDDGFDGFEAHDDLVARFRGTSRPDEALGADALQRIVFTSGTTGRPKGAMLSHGNVMANVYAQVVELGLTSDDRIMNFAPLYHVGGFDIPGFATFQVGATMYLVRRFDARSILELMASARITGTCMVATMVHLFRDLPESDAYDLRHVRWLIFSQVSQTLYRATRELFPAARLIEGYGLTETCNGLAYLDEAHMESKLGSVGRALPGVDLWVVDPDGRPLGPGGRGEVVARGPKVSMGYFGDDEATARTYRDGWFHTGDVGFLDDDGYLFIVDRLKDMIRSGGENVASSEIESVLYEVPSVAEAAVVGVPHPKWLEVPVAIVVARPGTVIVAREIIAHCNSRLGRFKVPKALFEVSELPRNPTGKVVKDHLRILVKEVVPVWQEDELVGVADEAEVTR